MSKIAQIRMPCGRCAPSAPCSPRDVRYPFALSVQIRHFRVVTPPTALTVVHVAANSPAEKAGWAVGDRIVAVNGHSIDANYTRGELWQVRSRPAGTLVKLTMASGDVRELRLADYY